MKTITAAVEDYIRSKPFLQTTLNQGIINLTSLSKLILEDIKDEVGKEIKIGAIVMALKRLSTNMEFRSTHRIVKVLKNIGDITVRANLIDYSFEISETILTKQAELLRKINNVKDVFFTSSRGVNEMNIIISNHIEKEVETIFAQENLLQKFANLGGISVKLPKENISVPGIYYFIFQRLAWEGITINEVISTSNEFTIIIPETDVDTAFKVIKDLKKLK
ncbi:aspartate kinase [Capnocytophaga catalasegens]|uniref:aspartate kinase n=1 Tax=Capnocytophaga catalasegens TaxID=1004260 RepID=UPI00222E2D87|nr:aspartate kinase [Capnocytophaga catalasegens]